LSSLNSGTALLMTHLIAQDIDQTVVILNQRIKQ